MKNTIESIQFKNLGESDIEAKVMRYSIRKMILKKQKNAEGLCQVYVEISVYKKRVNTKFDTDRTIKRFPTGVSIAPSEWLPAKEEIRNNIKLNTQINTLYNRISNTVVKLSKRIEYVEVDKDLHELGKLFGNSSRKQAVKSLTSYLADYILFRKSKGTQRGTLKEFVSLRNRLLKYEAKKGLVTFEHINLTLSDNLISFWADCEYNPNTIKKSFEILKTFLNHYYLRREEMHLEISDKFKLKEFGNVQENQQQPVALNEEEIRAIRNFDLDIYEQQQIAKLKRKKDLISINSQVQNVKAFVACLRLTRERVLLQIATGLRVSDLFCIKPNNVIRKSFIRIKPKKTLNVKVDNTVIIPLFGMAKEVLEKYGFDSTKLRVTSQTYNKSIKDLLEVCGIDEELEITKYKGFDSKPEIFKKHKVFSSHNCRDTFITQCVRKNVPIPVILKWTGQSSFSVMKKYINLTEQDLVENISLFD